MTQNRPTGVPCPNCGTFIPMTVEGLLGAAPFTCPNRACETTLHINVESSRGSLEILEKFERETAPAQKLKKTFGSR